MICVCGKETAGSGLLCDECLAEEEPTIPTLRGLGAELNPQPVDPPLDEPKRSASGLDELEWSV
jgi:hypothetical protein